MLFFKKLLSILVLLIIVSVFFSFYSLVSAQQEEDILRQYEKPYYTPEQIKAVEQKGGTPTQTSAPAQLGTKPWPVETALPGIPKGTTFSDPGQYICKLYTIGLKAAGILAVLMIVYAGFLWMTSPAIAKIEQAKGMIWGAVGGLVLLFASYLILNTINPDLLKCSLPTLSFAPISPGQPTATGTSPAGNHNLSGIVDFNLGQHGMQTSGLVNDKPLIDRNCAEAAKQAYSIINKKYGGVITGAYDPNGNVHKSDEHHKGYGLDFSGGSLCSNKTSAIKDLKNSGWTLWVYDECASGNHLHVRLNCTAGTTQPSTDKGKPQATFKMNLKSQTNLITGTLTISTGDGKSISVNASAGRPGSQSPGDQSKKNFGPLPAGSWTINLSPTSADAFSGGNPTIRRAIGNDIAYLIPGTKQGRSGFAVHLDGDYDLPANPAAHVGPGSSGCIAVISKTDYEKVKNAFRELKEKGYSTIPLNVQY